ncbi:MAG: hypothetical protein DYG89_15265 [Caldilinea sp. CFX5]|nr:hypothetical protein [Caldilinea sp. CFX5]
MPRYLEQANECTDPVGGDWLWIVDASAGATDRDRKLNAGRLAILANANAFTNKNSFATTVGLTGAKASLAHNVATNFCRLTIGGGSPLAASYLIGICLINANTLSTAMYILNQGHSTVVLAEQAKALFGHTTVTVTATADAANRWVTLSMTQVNGSSQAVEVRVSVIPLFVCGDATITLTML